MWKVFGGFMVLNILKLSDDALLIQLNRAYDSDNEDLILLIEAELERRDDLYAKNEIARKQNELKRIENLKLLQEQMHDLISNFKGTKTHILVAKLGSEFEADYYICEDTFTVKSNADHPPFVQNTTWGHESLEEAKAKVVQLIYYRIYNHYMRNCTSDSLEFLKKVLAS